MIKCWSHQVCPRNKLKKYTFIKARQLAWQLACVRFKSYLMPVCSTSTRQLLNTFYLLRFMNFRILIWFSWDPWLCVWAFFSPNPKHINRFFLRAVKVFTGYTSIEQTLFKQIMTGDEVLALVHLFLLKNLLCICTVGFCDQASSWSSSCGWTEELCSQQPS